MDPPIDMKKLSIISESARETLARELKMWRLRQGLTQTQVAKKFKTSKWSVLRAEHDANDVSEETAYKIYAALTRELRIEGFKDPAEEDEV